MRVISKISAVLVCLLCLSGSSAQAAWFPDPLVTAKTKIAVFAETGLRGRDVHVDTVDGVVTIYGTVSDSGERRRIEEIAWGVKGVKDVRNLLQVVPPFFREMVDVTDAVIRMRVERSLEEDSALEGTDMKVKSVNNGVVLLAGEARTMSEYLIAIEDVVSVPGVRGIGSEVKSPDLVAELLANPDEVRDERGRGLSGAAADLWITTATKLRLLADPRVPGMDVGVDVWNGVVTLHGNVPTEDAVEAASEAARETKGVKAIENEIMVIPEPGREAIRARDKVLATEVRHALGATESVPGSGIRVEINGGVVRLTGTVPSEQHRLLAVTAAHATPGVSAVEEDLRVNYARGWK